MYSGSRLKADLAQDRLAAGADRSHREAASRKPLRHLKAPDLSFAGFRLVIADHALGLPVLRTLFLVYMLPPIPRRSRWA